MEYALALPQSHLALVAARELVALDVSGRKGWLSKLRDDLLLLGLTLPPNPDVGDVSDVLRRFENAVRLNVFNDINCSPKLDLLHSRRDFSSGRPRTVHSIAFRNYLLLKNRELRVALTKLVLSDHSLAIERLRWRNGRDYDIPQGMRLCRFCVQAVEDPLHALFQCTASDELRALRRQLWLRLTHVKTPGYDLAALRALTPADLLFCLLSFESSTEVLAFHAVQTLATYARSPMHIPTRNDVAAHPTTDA